MKLIHAVVNNEDVSKVMSALKKAKFYFTKLASSGGFLLSGNTTLMLATEDERVDKVIEILKKHCRQKKVTLSPNPAQNTGVFDPYPLEITMGGATVFITNIERFEKI